MDTLIAIITIVCGGLLGWSTFIFLVESGEKSKKAGTVCIILMLILFMLSVCGYLKDILETLGKMTPIKGG